MSRSPISLAHEFAAYAHRDQKRKYTGEPYFNHCEEVARLVSTVTNDSDMISAAYLHDVVEDTDISSYVISQVFSSKISDLVWWLTDKSRPEDGNRAARKKIDREWLGRAPNDAKTIKCADLISNTRSIVDRDPKFAKTYLAEKRLLMPCLVGADERLWSAANELAGAA